MTTKNAATTAKPTTEAKERIKPGPKPGAKAAAGKSTAKPAIKPATKAAVKPAAKAAAKPAAKPAVGKGDTSADAIGSATVGTLIPRALSGRALADVAIAVGVVGSGLTPLGELTLLDVDKYAAVNVPLAILPTHRIELKSKDKLTSRMFYFRYESFFKDNKTVTQNEVAVREAMNQVAADLIEAQSDGANWLQYSSAETPPSVATEQQSNLMRKMLMNGVSGMDHLFLGAPSIVRRGIMSMGGLGYELRPGARKALEQVYGVPGSKPEEPAAPEPTHLNLLGEELPAKDLRKFVLMNWATSDIDVSIADYDLEMDISSIVFGDQQTNASDSVYEVVISAGAISWTKYLYPFTQNVGITLDQLDPKELLTVITKGARALKVDSSYFKVDFTKADVELRRLK